MRIVQFIGLSQSLLQQILTQEGADLFRAGDVQMTGIVEVRQRIQFQTFLRHIQIQQFDAVLLCKGVEGIEPALLRLVHGAGCHEDQEPGAVFLCQFLHIQQDLQIFVLQFRRLCVVIADGGEAAFPCLGQEHVAPVGIRFLFVGEIKVRRRQLFPAAVVLEEIQVVIFLTVGGVHPVNHQQLVNLVITVKEYKPKAAEEQPMEMELYDPMLDLAHYDPPTAQLLVDHKTVSAIDEEEIFRNKERIRETLLHFHIPIISMTATVGPTVTLYEIVQEPGVKISRIQGLEDDLAQNLRAQSVRIIAPMPGRGTIGIEVPNHTKQTVSMRSSICSEEFQNSKAELPVVIGRTIQNENYTFDLAKLPHLLVAGATGQGKSVGLNAIITSLLYRKHPAELKFVLIDPKMVEFSLYNKLEKHFLAKMESEDDAIVTDPKIAVNTLNSLCAEMETRLELCKKAGAKNIVEYNDKFLHRRLNPENGHRFLPYIVVVIDEFADLIMTAKEVEKPVMRLAQKARAIGIHLIVATQRPDVKVITGGIKANFPARIAFRVMQMTDSRTIIDQPGANQLIGRGDMLFLSGGEPTRIQCAFVDTPEVERIVDHIGSQQGYTSAYNLPDYIPESGSEAGVSFGSEESSAPQKYDPKFAEIAREAVTSGVISTSMIQRNFEVGFNRAGRIMLQLERAGIVGPQVGSKQREIRYYDIQSLEARLQELGVF